MGSPREVIDAGKVVDLLESYTITHDTDTIINPMLELSERCFTDDIYIIECKSTRHKIVFIHKKCVFCVYVSYAWIGHESGCFRVKVGSIVFQSIYHMTDPGILEKIAGDNYAAVRAVMV